MWLRLIAFLYGLWKNRGPSPIVQEAEKLGAAQQALAQEKAANDEITRAAAAGDSIAGVLDDPERLRQYAEHDPNNLANR